MKVSVVGGAGYVGLVTGVGLAAIGHDVTCIDVDDARIAMLQSGVSPVYDDGLEAVLRDCLEGSRIRFTASIHEALQDAEVIVVAVGTPAQINGETDLSQVIQVAEALAAAGSNGYQVIVVKSTVPVGAVDLVRTILTRQKQEGIEFDIVANPEFLREGRGLQDFLVPDRLIVGATSERAVAVMRQLYDPILTRVSPNDASSRAGPCMIETDPASAQMTKYAANAFLALRISFINEIAGLCERVGADVREVVRGLLCDSRFGSGYLDAGLGFGGPCLEKDLKALISTAEANQYDVKVLRATLERNNQQLEDVLEKVKRMIGGRFEGRTVSVFGLAFKGGTNDLRNSLSIRLIERLQGAGAVVRAYDPVVKESSETLSALSIAANPYEAARGASALIIATDWPQFRDLDYRRIKELMLVPAVVDARNILPAARLRALGLNYSGVGIPDASSVMASSLAVPAAAALSEE